MELSMKISQLELDAAFLRTLGIEAIRKCLDLEFEDNFQDKYGNTPLHLASNIELVKILLKHGASVCVRNNEGQTPLHVAIKCNRSFEVVSEFLQYGAEVNAKDGKYRTPLEIALNHPSENWNIIHNLLLFGASIHEKNKSGDSFLHIAIKKEKGLVVIQALLESGININAKDRNHNTALHVALLQPTGTLNLVRLILKYGASVHDRNAYNQTPLHIAVDSMKVDIIEELLKNGAKINEKDLFNITPLLLALNSFSQNFDIIKSLLQCGASVFNTNIQGQSALHIAIEYGKCLEIIHEILKYGADVNTEDTKSRTPLYLALNNPQKNFYIIKLLLKYGASLHERNTLCQIIVNIVIQHKLSQQLIRELLRYSLIEHWDTTYSSCIFCNTLFLNCPEHRHYITELNKMKNEYVVNNLTLYDFIVLKKDYGKYYLKDVDMLTEPSFLNKLITEYPHYYDIVLNTLESKLYLKEKLCDLSVYIQSDPIYKIINLNSDCLREIGRYLTKDELQNFVSAILLKD